jgi:hypothetical protein
MHCEVPKDDGSDARNDFRPEETPIERRRDGKDTKAITARGGFEKAAGSPWIGGSLAIAEFR